jgi:hypothetical protein
MTEVRVKRQAWPVKTLIGKASRAPELVYREAGRDALRAMLHRWQDESHLAGAMQVAPQLPVCCQTRCRSVMVEHDGTADAGQCVKRRASLSEFIRV